MARRRSLSVAAALSLAVGCASRHTASYPLAPETLAELSAGVEGRKAVVRYTSLPLYSVGAMPRVFTGQIQVRGEQLLIADDEREIPVPLARVQEIDANHPVLGGVKGGGVGLVAGLLVGILVGSVFEDTCGDGRDTCSSHPASIALITVVAGLLGVAIGAPIGAIRGAGPIWRLSPGAP